MSDALINYIDCSWIVSSVEAGTEIVPAFDTSVGRVGLLICFDVSRHCKIPISF